MKWTKILPYVCASVLAGSLLVLPITAPLSAQTTAPAPEPTRVETRLYRDYTGLWGLLGLLGLAGLAGRRRPDTVQMYTTPEQPHTETRGSR